MKFQYWQNNMVDDYSAEPISFECDDWYIIQNQLLFTQIKKSQTQMLGLKLLDEPSAQQTDPSVLELHLRWGEVQFTLCKVKYY